MDKCKSFTVILFCVAWLCAVALCFALLQNKVVYNAVSGVVKTYRVERAEDGSKLVTLEKQPFNRIENEQLLQWDADIYRLMSQHLYDPEYVWPGYVAFFPLFPMVWRLTGLSPIGICLLNFVLFVAGLLVLIAATNNADDNCQQRFAVLLCMPFLVIFLIPYSEALFFLCISVGLYGLLRNRYWLYFVGFMLGCMTRAAGSILLVAWIIADILYVLQYRLSWRQLFRNLALHLAPVVAGVAAVMLIQSISGHAGLFAFAGAQFEWGKEWSLPTWPLTDWSEESKSVTQPLLFILFLPALAWLCVRLIKAMHPNGTPQPQAANPGLGQMDSSGASPSITSGSTPFIIGGGTPQDPVWLVRVLSVLFFVGNIVLALFTQKGCMFSQARLLTCTPFFFFLMMDFGGALRGSGREAKVWRWVVIAFMVLAAVLCRLMLFKAQTLGTLLVFLMTVLVLFTPFKSKVANRVLLGVTLFLNVYWTAYLFNCYLSGGWIFT